VARELAWLAEHGLVLPGAANGPRSYLLSTSDPATQQLGRLVRQTRGGIPEMRKALSTLRTPVISWETSMAVLVLTAAPRRLVGRLLDGVIHPGVLLQTMSFSEWIARLQKGDVTLRQARRARKLWIVGSWDGLVAAERRELETRRLLLWARANWREELSDEWDEDWDPLSSTAQAAGA